MASRREFLSSLVLGGAALLAARRAVAVPEPQSEAAVRRTGSHRRVVVPNGTTLPWKMRGGFKEFHLVAQPCEHEFAPGTTVKAWGYNGSTPGPVIEAIEGDRVRILVTNRLPEHTTIHWHGIFLPNGMDGVGGLNQPQIGPGETFAYEFTLRQHGTFMYHPHADEMVQMAVGMWECSSSTHGIRIQSIATLPS